MVLNPFPLIAVLHSPALILVTAFLLMGQPSRALTEIRLAMFSTPMLKDSRTRADKMKEQKSETMTIQQTNKTDCVQVRVQVLLSVSEQARGNIVSRSPAI